MRHVCFDIIYDLGNYSIKILAQTNFSAALFDL